jgi:hypothetical protein
MSIVYIAAVSLSRSKHAVLHFRAHFASNPHQSVRFSVLPRPSANITGGQCQCFAALNRTGNQLPAIPSILQTCRARARPFSFSPNQPQRRVFFFPSIKLWVGEIPPCAARLYRGKHAPYWQIPPYVPIPTMPCCCHVWKPVSDGTLFEPLRNYHELPASNGCHGSAQPRVPTSNSSWALCQLEVIEIGQTVEPHAVISPERATNPQARRITSNVVQNARHKRVRQEPERC